MSGRCAFEGDALRADELLRGLRKKRAGFHGRVVGDDHARHAGDVADARDGAGGRDAAPLLVHFVGGPEPSSKNCASRSSKRAMRSRAGSRPILRWRSWPALPPPSRNGSSSARILSQRSRSVSALAVRDDMRWTLNPACALVQARRRDALPQTVAWRLVRVRIGMITGVAPDAA